MLSAATATAAEILSLLGEEPVVAGAEPPVLQLEGVTAGYARRRSVVHDIDLLVRRGETVGLVGESGSGKSTLARIITGLLPASAGAVRFQGAALPRSLGARKRDVLRRVRDRMNRRSPSWCE